MLHSARFATIALIAGIFVLSSIWPTSASAVETRAHALSLIGEPKYGPDAAHLDWVNPDAPKGGTLRMATRGTFDSFNPFALKGTPAIGLGLTLQTLMTTQMGEMSTEYPEIAENVIVADDLSYVRFDINPAARFHDGRAITVGDVIYSFEALTGDSAPPNYRSYYANVARAERTAPQQVTFYFSGPPNRELPQIMGQLPILSKADWAERDMTAAGVNWSFLGSGAYRIKDFEAGRFIEYERVKNWWAEDLLVNRGRNNFDIIRYDYYRDDNALRLAFQKGLSDYRQENTSLHWAKSYDFPAVKDGRVIKTEIDDRSPQGMQSFVMNTRRPQFADRRVRKAITLAFDFEWTNRERFFNAYTRTTSYFQNSVFASSGLPSEAELALLTPLKADLPPELFNEPFEVPVTDGSGRIRAQLREAKKLLEAAGWRVDEDQILRNANGVALKLEVMLISPAFERIVDPFLQNLQKLGIQTSMVLLPQPEYVARMRSFDFDVVVTTWGQSNSPGNEQRDFWGTTAAGETGSRNYAGIQNPAIDALIDHVIAAQSRAALITATQALDRALLWGYYVVPNWHVNKFRIAYWDRFGRPEKAPSYGVGVMSWWQDDDKAAIIDTSRAEE